MKVAIDLARASARHPAAVAEIVADMNRKLKKAKQPAVTETQLDWGYDWCVAINGGDKLDNCCVFLEGYLGKRSSIVDLCPSFQMPVPRADLPPEIVAAYAPGPVLDATTYPHVAAFTLTDFGGKTGPALATGGYRSKRGSFIHHVKPGDELRHNGRAFEILLRIDGDKAVWSGGLVKSARERFDATPQGGVFRYRNAPLTRLTNAEVHALVAGRHFKLVM